VFAAAFAALLLALVHPFCSIPFVGTGAAHAAMSSPETGGTLPDTCCSDAKDGALAKPAGVLMASPAEDSFGAPLGSWIRLPASSHAGAVVDTALAAPPQRSYYARSARILR